MMDKMIKLLILLAGNRCMKEQCSPNLLVFEEFDSKWKCLSICKWESQHELELAIKQPYCLVL